MICELILYLGIYLPAGYVTSPFSVLYLDSAHERQLRQRSVGTFPVLSSPREGS